MAEVLLNYVGTMITVLLGGLIFHLAVTNWKDGRFFMTGVYIFIFIYEVLYMAKWIFC